MRIIQIKAASRETPVEMPYLFNVKDTAKIQMTQDDFVLPENGERVLECAMTPEFTPDELLKSLTITYKDAVIWTHTFSIGAQRFDARTHWCFMSMGADMHKELSEIIQLYEMPKAGPRLSKEVLLYKLCEETLCFPKEIDDRSLVKMIEEGCIEYEGLKSTAIKRREHDSKWVEITFG